MSRSYRKISSRKSDAKLPPAGVKAEWVWGESNKQLDYVCRGETKSFTKRNLSRGALWEKLHPRGSEDSPHQDSQELTVSLKNVKDVAVDCINSELIRNLSMSSVVLFDIYFKSEQVDNFLWCLILYMDTFFKLELQASEDTRVLAAGLGDDRGPANQAVQLLHRYQAAMAESYCRLILGVDMEEHHHMKAGKSRISKSKSDREFFEVFYEFLMSVIWVVFHRQHWQLIHREVGRLLRTMSFNRSLLPEEPGDVDSEEEQEEVDKTHIKSFSSGALHDVHSPILTTLFPNMEVSPSISHPTLKAPSKEINNGLLSSLHNGTCLQEIVTRVHKVGILGKPLSKYNKNTLLLQDDSDLEDVR